MLCVLVDAISYFVSDVILNPDCLVSRPAACYSSGHFQNVLQYEQAQRHAARTWVYRRYIRRIKDCGYWRQLRTLAISLRSVTTSRVRFYWIGTLKWNNSSDGVRRSRESVSSLVSPLVQSVEPSCTYTWLCDLQCAQQLDLDIMSRNSYHRVGWDFTHRSVHIF